MYRSSIYIISSLLLLLAGCHRPTPEEIARRERAQKRALVITTTVVGLAAAAFAVWVITSGRREEREQELLHAEERYNRTAEEIKNHLPACAYILREDGKKGRVFRWRSGSTRARQKSVELIVGARYYAKLLFDFYPTKEGYVAREELERLYNCCIDCAPTNKGTRNPKCLALRDSEGIVDLEFKSSEQ